MSNCYGGVCREGGTDGGEGCRVVGRGIGENAIPEAMSPLWNFIWSY